MSYSEFKESTEVQEDLAIDFILEEAGSFNLRREVQETARKIKEEFPEIRLLTAYKMSLNEWIK